MFFIKIYPIFAHRKAKEMNTPNQTNGSITLHASLPYQEIRPPKDYIYYKVRVRGGLGGDAETDIVKQRANCIKVLANILLVCIRHQHVALYLVRFEGGESAQTIPANAEALVAIPSEMEQDFKDIMIQGSCALQAQYGVTDPDVEVLLDSAIWHGNIIDEEATRCLLASLNAIPTGPLEMRTDLVGTAMTSNSIGSVKMNRTTSCFEIMNVCQSFKDDDLHLLASKIRQILEVSGAEIILNVSN